MLGFLPLPPLPFQSLKYVKFMLQEDMSSWMVLPFSPAKCYLLQSNRHWLDLEGPLKATDSNLGEEMLLCHLPTYRSSSLFPSLVPSDPRLGPFDFLFPA